jgi:hypothetical protein
VDADDIIMACDLMGLAYGPARGVDVGNISIACPIAVKSHGDAFDANLSCSVSYGGGRSLAKCFSSNCQYHGSFMWLLRQASDLRPSNEGLKSFIEAFKKSEKFDASAHLASIEASYEPDREADKPKPKVDPLAIPESSLSGFDYNIHPYAVQRGITQTAWERWGLAFDQALQRIVFPVRRTNGTLIGLTGRDVTGISDRKYHNYSGLKRSEVLFGEQLLVPEQPLVIVEGQIDAILVDAATGIPAVAPLGEGFSPKHVAKICDVNPPYIVLFPDNDSAGRIQASKIAHSLEERFFLQLAVPPPGKDPGDMTPEEIRECVENSKPVLGALKWIG